MTKAKYRHNLPQLNGRTLLSDSGLETTLIFHDGIDLPCFASFVLLKEPRGYQRLLEYYREHAAIAARHGVGFVLETVTWRAHSDWGDRLGYDAAALAEANRQSVAMMTRVRAEFETAQTPYVISGNIGPRSDGYAIDTMMTADEAQAYHAPQIAVLADAGVDMISFFTANYAAEAIGIVRAAQKLGVPSVISFTTETDGKLPSGQALGDAIMEVEAATAKAPAYYMINCAHPTHFSGVVAKEADWLQRILGIRANASKMSHAELDNSEVLDDGDPLELGAQYRELTQVLPNLRIFGGCCGTDHRHVTAISEACLGQHHSASGGHDHVEQA